MHLQEFISDLAVEEDGTMLILLSRKTGEEYSLTRCTRTGEPLEKIETTDFPPEFSGDFSPCSITSREGRIYLVDKEGMKAVVTDDKGRFLEGYYITADGQAENGPSSCIESFNLDTNGSLSFTLSCSRQSQAVVIPMGGKENPTVDHTRPSVSTITYCVISIVGLIVSWKMIL